VFGDFDGMYDVNVESGNGIDEIYGDDGYGGDIVVI
jgi:hypothetical protein